MLYIPLFLNIATKGNDHGFFSKEYTEYDEEPTKEVIRFNRQIRMNMCRILCNLSKFYGDKKTVKNTTAISYYLMGILSDCLVNSFSFGNWEDKNYNISSSLFKVINCQIEYSALDFQDHIEIVMQKVLEFYEMTIDDFFTITKGENLGYHQLKIFGISNESIVKDFTKIKNFLLFLNENVCLIFVSIYRKILRNIKSELSNKTLYLVMKSFELRNEVYENGLLLISQIIISKLKLILDSSEVLHNYYIPIINMTRNTLNNFSDSSNCKAAILLLSNLVTICSEAISPYLDEFIPIIFKIIQDENAHSSLKPISLSILGDLTMNFPTTISNEVYFNRVFDLLFSACDASLEISENNDNEFNKNLQKVIIDAFTSITFSVRDLSSMPQFSSTYLLQNYSTYIEKIFHYIERILVDSDDDLIMSCFAFISDVVQMYPNNSLKINKNMLENNLHKLKCLKCFKEKHATVDWIEKTLNSRGFI